MLRQIDIESHRAARSGRQERLSAGAAGADRKVTSEMMSFDEVVSIVASVLAMDHAKVRAVAVAMRQQGRLDHRADVAFDLGQAIVIMVTVAATERLEDLVRAATAYTVLPLQGETRRRVSAGWQLLLRS